jgi:hypothetical protein
MLEMYRIIYLDIVPGKWVSVRIRGEKNDISLC